MPTYEYVCEKCGHQFDLIQSIKANPITICPKDLCPKKTWAKGRVRKQINAGAGLLFKGTGFYITDYRSEGYKAAAKKDSAGTGGTSTGASDAKGSGDSRGSGASSGSANAPASAAKTPKADTKPAPKSK